MKYFMSIFLTVFSNTILFSQLVPSLQQKTSYSIMFFGAQHAFTKVGADSWASGGTGVVDQGASGAIFNNPACMNFQSLTLSAQVSERTRIKMLSLDYDGLFIPTQLSGGMKLNKWNLSVGYVNYFSYYSFSSMKETTPAHPEGTGRYFILGDDIKSHTFMGSANYIFDDISLGLTMAANYLNWDNSRYVYDDTHSGLGLIAIGGVLLKPSEKFNIGLSCKYASPIGWTDKGNYETYEYKTYSPWTMEAGCSIKLLSGLKVLTSIEWECPKFS